MSCNNLIQLRWLNTLGGWDQFTFTARHTYGYDISNVQDFNVDIFDNWDTDYIAGEVETKTLSLDAAETITLRTGGLTKEQVQGLAPIKYAIAVQTVQGDEVNANQTVKIDRGSFEYRTDREKNIELTFRITRPKIQIQTA